MTLGFTGTREGMTAAQLAAFEVLVESLPDLHAFHHGACVGADEQAARVVMRDSAVFVVARPCTLAAFVSQKALQWADFVHTPVAPLDRNRIIVAVTHRMIATPAGPETKRSGTWSTIRYAKSVKRPLTIIWPDGTITE